MPLLTTGPMRAAVVPTVRAEVSLPSEALSGWEPDRRNPMTPLSQRSRVHSSSEGGRGRGQTSIARADAWIAIP